MLGRAIATSILLSSIVLIFIFQSTTPSTIGPAGILAVFFLLYVLSLSIFAWLIYSVSWIVVHVAQPMTIKKPLTVISMRHAYYHASILAMAPVMLIGMNSVGKLGVYEVGLVIIFVIMGEFYVRKRIE